MKCPDYELIQAAIESADAESAIIGWLKRAADKMATYGELTKATGFSYTHVQRVGTDLLERKIVDSLTAYRVSPGGHKKRVRVLRLRQDHI